MSNKKIIIVTNADMEKTVLGAAIAAVTPQRLGKVAKSASAIIAERVDYEANRERMIDGVLTIGQSPDIKHLQALDGNEAFLRMSLALNLDLRTYLFPQSLDGGKTSEMTSNLKALRKVRQIAETIASGVSDLEKVARVFSVCAYRFADAGNDTLTREYCKAFLSSYELQSLDAATAQIWSDIDDIRAKEMSGGAETQSGQMVRSLVALGGAVDVRDGREKHVRILHKSPVMEALAMRFGLLTDATA
jgi:hypothetical protein